MENNIIEGISLIKDKKSIPTDLDSYLCRSVFTLHEGRFVAILLKTSSIPEVKMTELWKQHYQVSVIVEGQEFEQAECFKCMPFVDDTHYIVVGKIDWTEIMKEGYHQIELCITIGYRRITFTSHKYITVLPKRMVNKVELLDMFLTSKRCINPDDDLDKYAKYGFEENEKGYVWLTCKNNFSDFVNDNLLAEIEFQCYDEKQKLIDRQIGYGVETEMDNQVMLFCEELYMSDWPKGTYSIRACLWGTVIAETVFIINQSLEGKYPFTDLTKKQEINLVKKHQAIGGVKAIEKINSMIGLGKVKKHIRQNIDFAKFEKARRDAGLPCNQRLQHIIMTGDPGTGKTTVARLLSEAYHQIGLLEQSDLVEVDRSSLVGQYIGETEKKTRMILEEAKGKTLFIDEAYTLASETRVTRDYGVKVIDTLMTFLSEVDNSTLVILAGYPTEMNQMLKSNPGLRSRFPIHLHFDNYTVAELVDIATGYLEEHRYNANSQVMERMTEILRFAVKYKNFGNGHFVKVLIDNYIIPNMATRLSKKLDGQILDVEELINVKPEDVPDIEQIMPLLGNEEKPRKRAIGFR